jgi:hypothetical protein
MADEVAREQHLERNSEGVEQHPEIRSLHLARFSEGLEQLPDSPSKLHLGRFSEGLEQLPETPSKRHLGRFSEGLEQLPETAKKLRRGSFADGFEEVRQRNAGPGHRGGGSGRGKPTARARRGVYIAVAPATTVRDRPARTDHERGARRHGPLRNDTQPPTALDVSA